MEEDLILGEPEKESITILDIIESQLYIISEVMAQADDIYDKQHQDKVETIAKAFKVIQKAQDTLMRNL
jgi:hypothetical protein